MERVERRQGVLRRFGSLFSIGAREQRFIAELNNSNTGAFELVLTPLILALVGFGLDHLFGTGHILTVVFFVLGFVGVAYKLYLEYTERMKKAEEGKPWKR